jgi:hypothetical protein
MVKTHLRVVVRLVLLFLLVFALSLSQGWATTIGSTTTNRSFTDTAQGQVYIYNGGSGSYFTPGDTVTGFSWFGSVFSGTRDLTPLLFQDVGGVYTVVAIGGQESVNGAGGVTSVSFGQQAGSLVIPGTGNYTFGFVTGLADSSGGLSDGTSAGSIKFDSTVDGGAGVSGGTNDWVFTPTITGLSVALGTEFGGSNGTTLNSGSGSFNTDRTYSAQASDSSSGVAEPGTFSLITGAGLVLAGLFRYRYTRGRQS